MATASYAPLTACAREGLARFERSYEAQHPWDAWAAELEELRGLAAAVLGVPDGEVALPASACSGLAVFLEGLMPDHRTILVADSCFPGIAQACHAQVRLGARVRSVPFDDIAELTTDDPPLAVVVPQLCSQTGYLLNVDRVVSCADASGAVAIVDCSHGLGHLPPPPASVVLSSGYKYLFGVPGVACMRVRNDWAERSRPAITGWFGARDVLGLRPVYDPAEGARRFDAGTPSFPAVFALVGALRALKQILTDEPGLPALITGALRPLQSQAEGRDFGFVSLCSTEQVVDVLSHLNIVADRRAEGIRIAPSVANTVTEVERVVDAICSTVEIDAQR
jgi:selenocysteine lyase/cysteine desulfurase